MKRLRLSVLAAVLALAAAAPAPALATFHGCKPVRDPYPGSRYAHVDLTRIKASAAVSCTTARRVARGAHRKALKMGTGGGSHRFLMWHGWTVTGDLEGDHDKYVARKDDRQVRWRF
jgi:hypothetical protein